MDKMRTNKIDNKKEKAKSNDKGFTMILNKFVWLMNLSLNCCGRSFVYCFFIYYYYYYLDKF